MHSSDSTNQSSYLNLKPMSTPLNCAVPQHVLQHLLCILKPPLLLLGLLLMLRLIGEYLPVYSLIINKYFVIIILKMGNNQGNNRNIRDEQRNFQDLRNENQNAQPNGNGTRNKKKVHTIKNQSHIKKETIKLSKFNKSDTRYTIDFNFDANYECIITIYVCARECRNAANISLLFYTDP